MTENQRKSIMILADTITGEINRMCVTSELSELGTMHLHAKRKLDNLLRMVCEAKFAAESEDSYTGDDPQESEVNE